MHHPAAIVEQPQAPRVTVVDADGHEFVVNMSFQELQRLVERAKSRGGDNDDDDETTTSVAEEASSPIVDDDSACHQRVGESSRLSVIVEKRSSSDGCDDAPKRRRKPEKSEARFFAGFNSRAEPIFWRFEKEICISAWGGGEFVCFSLTFPGR